MIICSAAKRFLGMKNPLLERPDHSSQPGQVLGSQVAGVATMITRPDPYHLSSIVFLDSLKVGVCRL